MWLWLRGELIEGATLGKAVSTANGVTCVPQKIEWPSTNALLFIQSMLLLAWPACIQTSPSALLMRKTKTKLRRQILDETACRVRRRSAYHARRREFTALAASAVVESGWSLTPLSLIQLQLTGRGGTDT